MRQNGQIVQDVNAMLQGTRRLIKIKHLLSISMAMEVFTGFLCLHIHQDNNWVKFHEIKQDVMLRIIRIVHEHQADFAFPTTTVDGIDQLVPAPGFPEPDRVIIPSDS